MSMNLKQLRARMSEKPFSIVAKEKDTKAEIIIYSDIGESWWGDGLSAKQFADTLASLPSTVNEITVRINSPGGNVFDGITIYNRLKQHKAKVIVRIDGIAASIASIIALAGDEVIMGEGTMLMVHKPWTWAQGNSNDFDDLSRRLIEIEDQMVGIYMRRSNLTREEVKDLLKNETYIGAEDAKKYGFADKVEEEGMPIAASMMERPWIHRQPKSTQASLDEVVKSEVDAILERANKILNKA